MKKYFLATLFLSTVFLTNLASGQWVGTGPIYTTDDDVGIGTSSPGYPLHIIGNTIIESGVGSGYFLFLQPLTNNFRIRTYNQHLQLETRTNAYDILFNTDNSAVTRMKIDMGTGYVGIGTTAPQSELAVNGTITAKEVEVTSTGWPDFVFAPGYHLKSLAEVEQFIAANGHLPEVPSAQKVATNGLALGKSQAMLLKKIEELTLYVIQLDREKRALKIRVDRLER